MDCLNHPGREAKSFCQNCGKPMCVECVRRTPSGHILCEQCLLTSQPNANQEFWQAAQAFVANAQGVPNPSAAAVLGLIPGVGAMYNGQLFKGLIHVVIFAVLVSMAQSYGVFGIFIGAWVLYQSFEAYQTAKARRDGTPLPDPFGLNELGGWLNLGGPPRHPNPGQPGPVQQPGAGQTSATGATTQAGTQSAATQTAAQSAPWSGQANQTGQSAAESSVYGVPYTPPVGGWNPAPGEYAGTNPTPGYTTPPYGESYMGYGANPDPYASSYPPGYVPPGSYPPGNYPPGYVPPIPPVPPPAPYGWRGREPAWAFILIILGLVFLFKTMGFVGHLFHFAWPILLIGFGAWMIVRRVGNTQGGPK